jgi:hypothetical protein
VAENLVDSSSETETDSNDKLLDEAKARLKLSEEAEAELRRLALEDLKFRAGEQWPDGIVQERQNDGRPCLVINRIPQFIQQVTNDQRQNRPSIKVHPVDDHGDVDTGKVIQGLIRHIEYNSNADAAYDTAFDSACTGGFGYFRIITDYVNPMGFEQEILIKRIRNPFSVFFDPHSQEPDGSDASFAFVIEDLSKEEYEARYPKSKLAGGDWESVGNSAPTWMKDGSARVAEYFYKEIKEQEIVLLSDGQVLPAEALAGGLPPGLEVVRSRIASIPVIKWCKLNACEILEQTEWPGSYIPIVPVYGTEYYIDGKRVLEGIVRNAKDSQRMYNYWASAETEAIALAPRAPFIAAEGQLEGHESAWEVSNRRNVPVLKYKPQSVNGTLVGPPQRQVFEPAVQAITNARMIASEDLKATTGIYDAALGAKSNESSGIAIQRRNMQAQTSNFHFIDNLTRSLKHAGRILVDLIPKIYDTERAARIIGEDGEQKVVRLNAVTEDNGKEVLYKLDTGKYDVTIDVGPSFASKRQEALAAMMEMTKAYPTLMQTAGDLILKNMDAPGASEIAERMKKMLPPELADDGKNGEPLPPQVQAQMQQMGQMVEQLTGKLNELQAEKEMKLLEMEHKERIEFRKLEVELEIKRAELDAKDGLALLSAEIEEIRQRQALLRIDQPIDSDAQNFEAPIEPAPQGDEMGGGFEDPTGGESPGLPMEGISSDDPEQF